MSLVIIDEVQTSRCMETIAVREFVRGTTSMSDVKEVLGKPDFRTSGSSKEAVEFINEFSYSKKGRSLVYNSRDVWIYEHKRLFSENHFVYFIFTPKGSLRSVYDKDLNLVKMRVQKMPEPSGLKYHGT